jgi:predicted DNA binding protein
MGISVPVGVLGLVDDRPLPKGTSLRVERTASVSGCGSSSFVVSGADVAAVVRTIRERPGVEDVAVISDTGDEVVVRLSWDETLPDLLACIREHDGTVLSATARNDDWTFELRFTSRGAASEFYTRYDDTTYPLTIRRMNQPGNAHRMRNGLTPEQRAALSVAIEAGYFEVPRQTTLIEIADELDISDTAVSQRLRRGLATVLGESAYVRSIGDTTRQDD